MPDLSAFVSPDQLPIFVSAFIFLSGMTIFLAIVYFTVPALQARSRLERELTEAGYDNRRSLEAQGEIRRLATQKPVQAYFRAVERGGGREDAIEKRLFEAGFYNRSALYIYNAMRIVFVAGGFLVVFIAGSALFGGQVPTLVIFLVSLFVGLGFIVIPSIALDFYANGVKETYRRGFPDFMDMMITCADAGLSLEAAVERVSHEFSASHRHLGVQLTILTLQLRAGRPLRDALRDLADRIGLDEAKSLAVLFRQSEELGTSLVDALRVYANEMRTQRVLRAEEKANSLPVRMVIPLGLCVFPVIMMIVMPPVILRLRGVFF